MLLYVYIFSSVHIDSILGNVDISEFPDILVCEKHTIEKHANVASQKFVLSIHLISAKFCIPVVELYSLLPTLGSSCCCFFFPLQVNVDLRSWITLIILIYPDDFFTNSTRSNSCQLNRWSLLHDLNHRSWMGTATIIWGFPWGILNSWFMMEKPFC